MPPKVVFLTNTQLRQEQEDDCRRLLVDLLLLPSLPRRVVWLLPATDGAAAFAAHTELHGRPYGVPPEHGTDADAESAARTRARLDRFMESSVLPAADLIICSGATDCDLAASLDRVRQKAASPPVLGLVFSYEILFRALNGLGRAGELGLAAAQARGGQYLRRCRDNEIQRCDVIASADALVVFEALEGDHDNCHADANVAKKWQLCLQSALEGGGARVQCVCALSAPDYARSAVSPTLFLDCGPEVVLGGADECTAVARLLGDRFATINRHERSLAAEFICVELRRDALRRRLAQLQAAAAPIPWIRVAQKKLDEALAQPSGDYVEKAMVEDALALGTSWNIMEDAAVMMFAD